MKLRFVLALAAMALVHHPREAAACSPVQPEPGWTVGESVASANGLPTDAPIPLGLRYTGTHLFATEAERGTVRVKVTTLDGVEVEGAYEPNDVGTSLHGFDDFFRPRAPLAPNTRYRITTTIEDAVILQGPATRTFEVVTTSGPIRLAVPSDIVATAELGWQSSGGAPFACCDGGNPRDVDSCGNTNRGHCFALGGEPRMLVALSWSPLAASDASFLSFALVDPDGPLDGYRTGIANGATSASVRFERQAERYCVALEVTNRAIAGAPTVKSAPICVEHGARPSFEDFVPDFSSEASSCKGIITKFDATGTSTSELYVPGKASALDGGCSTTGHGTGSAGLIAVAVVLSARGRRTRRSSPCS